MLCIVADLKIGDPVIVMRCVPEEDDPHYLKTSGRSLKKDQAKFLSFYVGRIGEVFDIDKDIDPYTVIFYIKSFKGEMQKRYMRFKRDELEYFRTGERKQ